ncbi:MAG: DUF4396 domain-containing protein, partial [Spirochaetes bacterium]|nr:DUF4396 domain-containing protein [Spirochaetota bacterium]
MKTLLNDSCTMTEHGLETATAECCKPKVQIQVETTALKHNSRYSFWKDKLAWRKASNNTLNCLIGCSIGDFGMIIFLQAFYPQTSMWLMMALAMTMSLITSILLESTISKIKERFEWREAFNMAFSMSFISMLGM